MTTLKKAKPKVLVLRAPGLNRDGDAVEAIKYAGGEAELVHVNALLRGERKLADFQMLIIPGGFSYGDHLGAGRLLANDMIYHLGPALQEFVAAGKLVMGICNGFQVLVKTNLLPGWQESDHQVTTLYNNRSGRFECRWVYLQAEPGSPCVFTRGLYQPIYVPIAHGEGNFIPGSASVLARIQQNGHVAVRYTTVPGSQEPCGTPEAYGGPGYPANPNGSADAIAGICNATGTVFGLMPHPENAVFPWQHPRWTRHSSQSEGDGAALFKNAVAYLQEEF